MILFILCLTIPYGYGARKMTAVGDVGYAEEKKIATFGYDAHCEGGDQVIIATSGYIHIVDSFTLKAGSKSIRGDQNFHISA